MFSYGKEVIFKASGSKCRGNGFGACSPDSPVLGNPSQQDFALWNQTLLERMELSLPTTLKGFEKGEVSFKSGCTEETLGFYTNAPKEF